MNRVMEHDTGPDFYVLGSRIPRALPGRRRMRIEIEVDNSEDFYAAQPGSFVDININNPIEYSNYQAEITVPEIDLQRYEQAIQRMSQSMQEAFTPLATATEAELDRIAGFTSVQRGLPVTPPPVEKEPEPPKEQTRWGLLEID